ncbi:MAG: hypothetical protein A3B14_00905 [Candidatus Zambryskibacteria bacterium RIFCSPLOWO2_01_FULL_45_21]|uniref:Uncharacterized protein n=1 Tax=Candidatus Zambryskibacteria bacterium RIFCSPLOWO2_01_FULL_45_21 TaxID=1802761 RepID=A0A1G2U352_9BACT|nr:MAG: hypothetical protein A3B14_00905 [Candidatus Zambryskibacteria bacterium RIFCSPLOWO2_01_FULL_45_21]
MSKAGSDVVVFACSPEDERAKELLRLIQERVGHSVYLDQVEGVAPQLCVGPSEWIMGSRRIREYLDSLPKKEVT